MKSIETIIKSAYGEEADTIIREIKSAVSTNKILGKTYFANYELSSGWLTKKKSGQTVFTPKVYK